MFHQNRHIRYHNHQHQHHVQFRYLLSLLFVFISTSISNVQASQAASSTNILAGPLDANIVSPYASPATATSTATATAIAPATAATRDIDINASFQQCLTSKEILQLILQHLDEVELQDDDGIHVPELCINISNSNLENDGLEFIVDALTRDFEQYATVNTRPIDGNDSHDKILAIKVALEARMNQLTTQGLTTFIQQLFKYQDIINTNAKQQPKGEEEQKKQRQVHAFQFTSLDFSFNHFGLKNNHHHPNQSQQKQQQKQFRKAIQELIQGKQRDEGAKTIASSPPTSSSTENKFSLLCPPTLKFNYCGLGPLDCRSIGKGIVNAAATRTTQQYMRDSYDDNSQTGNQRHQQPRKLEQLYMSGNPIGDSGTTALAAAFKIAPSTTSNSTTQKAVLDTLDISSCHVGDVGVEALALAIISNPGCITNLQLSNNVITDRGAIALANAIQIGHDKLIKSQAMIRDNQNEEAVGTEHHRCYVIDCLDLSNNVDIGDDGAIALLDAVASGAIRKLILCSCSIRMDGISHVGQVLSTMMFGKKSRDKLDCASVYIDLSGNKFGTYRSKKKGGGYSATKMMSSMNNIGQKGFGLLKNGFKDIVDFSSSGSVGAGLESDDEAEEEDESLLGQDEKEAQITDKCGAILMYDVFEESLEDNSHNHGGEDEDDDAKENERKDGKDLIVGMRMCNFDNAAMDALAAIVMESESKDDQNFSIHFDCDMNRGCTDEEAILALKGSNKVADRSNKRSGGGSFALLEEMAHRHMDALVKRQKALEAKEAEARMNGLFADEYDDEFDEYEEASLAYDQEERDFVIDPYDTNDEYEY